ncbi:MAG TPA: trypsin-like peptidase domain-containing protein [Candidatus Methylomirabilis sp.]|nr:trypsin-like peptidase domain-containing protein [Candidatus Methylomirabilis sp.]
MIPRFAAVVALAFVLAGSPARAETTISVQEAMLRAKPAVAMVIAEVASEVTLDCGNGPTTVKPPPFRETGTGWFIDSNGWLVTNGHVVQPAYEKTPRWLVNQHANRAVSMACLPKALEKAGINSGEQPDKEDAIKKKLQDTVLPTAKVAVQAQVFVLVPNGSNLKAEVMKYSPPVAGDPSGMSGRDLALLKVPGENFPVLRLADSKVVQIGDPIHIIGFPGVVVSHELLNRSASVEASVTNGAVSGFKEDSSNNAVIQTDAPASWGNSGGPAVDDQGLVVGVLTFVSLAPGSEGGIVQGFNFLIPAKAVRTFVQGTPVNLDSPGKFNPIWYAGLREFFTDDWKGAVRKFEEVDKFHPGLPDVKRMLSEARDKVKNPPPRPFPWFWVAVGVTLVSAGGYGTQYYVRWQKNRYRIRPAEVIRLMEEGKQPILLDTRITDAYETLPLKIKDAVRLAPEELDSGISGLELDVNRPVIAYCTTPDEATSAKTAQKLRKLGFKDVRILKGGLGAWTNAGLPIESRSDLSQVGMELYKALATGS